MVVYYGVIKDHRVVLDDDVRLADGTRVEVRLQPAAPRDAVQGVVMAQSNIASMENVALGPFGTPPPKGKGSALVTPLSILERWPSPSPAATTRLKPELYALIVSLATEDGTTGYGTVALATGGAVYTLEHYLKPLVLGADVFDTNLLSDMNEAFWRIFTGEPRAEDGHVRLAGKPGLGLELNQQVVERYRVPLPL